MTWHGIGLISGNWAPLGNIDQLSPSLASIEPASAWDGTAGSGFAEIPSDPVRTIAKPALRLITPPNQWFTDTLDVGVIAMADDGGSLVNTLGVAEVKFHYEGAVTAVTEPGWHTIQTQRGPRTYFGWWVRLEKPADKAGAARLYVEATARDATFQRRVIGPFLFSPQTTEHDLELEINPDFPQIIGQRYQSLTDAVPFAVNGNFQNPRFTITKAGRYGLGAVSLVSIDRWTITGRFTVEGAVPGVIIGNNAYTTDAATIMSPQRTFWRFKGANVTFDARYGTSMSTNVSAGFGAGITSNHWADGCTITNTSPLGKNELIRGGQWNAGGLPINTWYTEADATKLNAPMVGASLIRGCYVNDSQSDIVSDSVCIINSIFEQSDQNDLNGNKSAFTMVYTGSESVATAARSGGNYSSGAGGGVWTVTIGATVYTFNHGNGTEAYFTGALGDGYWASDVVNWLNTLPDVSATLTPEFAAQDRVAAAVALRNTAGQGFAATSFKTNPLEIVWHADSHGDWYQHTRDNLENVIVAFNRAWDLETQLVYLAPPPLDPALGGVSNERDILFVGNQLAQALSHDALSQFTRRCDYSHVVFSHNTMPNQSWLFDSRLIGGEPSQTKFINNVVFKNNTLQGVGWREGVLPNITIENNHTHAANPVILGSVNTLASGNQDSLFVDFANGDFTPTALLRQQGFEPSMPTDFARQDFPSPAVPGAIALLADTLRVPPPPPEPSDDPLGELITLLNATGGQSAIHDYRNAAVEGGVFTSFDQTSNNNDHTQATAWQRPTTSEEGAVFASGSIAINQAISGGTFTIILGLTKADASIVGNVLSEVVGGNPTYQQDATGISGAGVLAVGGEIVATRAQFYTALHQIGYQVFTAEGMNMSGRTVLSVGRGGSAFNGTVRWAIMLDHAALGEDLLGALDLARAVVMA